MIADGSMESIISREAAPVESKAHTPSKSRSFSDPAKPSPGGSLAPSPSFREKRSGGSKDDQDSAPSTPKASRRPDFLARLSLQMPPSLSMPSPSQFPASTTPLSPQLDRNNTFMQQSPATSLPRHSRGLDFSRACTTLHHSTLAESSPDSSPVITQKPMMIPSRKGSMSGMLLDSPYALYPPGSVPWGASERSAVSSSVGSVNMLASESEDNDSDEDASMGGDDNDDPIFTTPQVRKLQNPTAATPFGGAPSTPVGGATLWGTGNHFSPAQASLMKTIRRTRLQKYGKRNRKSSSSASGSGYSSMASPRTGSPPPLRSIESTANGGYFNWPTAARSRRESLALGTDCLHISSGNDSGDEASAGTTPSTPAVVKRPVTRRGNLLPKTKGFARIRAALMEEAAPIDNEVRREAETMQQVRERDGSNAGLDLTPSERSKTATEQPSPSLLPTLPEPALEEISKDLSSDDHPKGLGMNFAANTNRYSGSLHYWNRRDSSFRTPPPPNFARHSSSAMSDINMDSSSETTPNWRSRPRTLSMASDAPSETATQSTIQANGNLINDDVHLNRFKRRREDDFDISTIKRRAVSPGMSANNSPVLTQSPSQKEALPDWGHPPERKEKGGGSQPQSASSETSQQGQVPALSSQQSSSRHGSGGSSMSLASGSALVSTLSAGSGGAGTGATTPTGGVGGASGGKKLGLQKMVDTNDGLMKMSIE